MSDRPIGLGKVAENGTLNENGAFYSVQDIETLLKKSGTPEVDAEDAGKVLTVGEDGEWEVSNQYDLVYSLLLDSGNWVPTLLHGDYNTLVQKITNKKLIKALAYKHAKNGSTNYYDVTETLELDYDENLIGDSIDVYAYFGNFSPIRSILNSDNEMVYPD